MLAEFRRRQMESLRLYSPIPFQDAYHRCTAKEMILLKGNRSGGSVAGFVEDARAALECDPYDKYPKGKGGVIICLGYGEGHIGRVIHRYLFRPGAFSIIQDEKTKDWRVFRPWPREEIRNGEYGDKGRETESMPAPPLIPKYRVKGKIAWIKRAHYVFSRVDLDTGWSIYAANSAGDASQFQGFDVSLYHIDEDLALPDWYAEASARTMAVNGLLRWTAMPHSRNEELVSLVRRADEEQAAGQPTTIVLKATMFDNPYLPKEAVEHNIRIWKSMGDDVYRQRALGELTMDSVKMYPEFDRRKQDYRTQNTENCRKLQAANGEVPEGWCRYIAVDPGNTICAIMYFAVPPESDQVYIYDEDYLPNGNASVFGIAMERKAKHHKFQAFIIDQHGGKLRDLGSGYLPRELYSQELERMGIHSVETGTGFLDGCDDLEGRETILREWIRTRADGSTRLVVNVERCPNFCREMEGFKKQFREIAGRKYCTDKGDRRYNTHAIECVEYAVAHGMRYVSPPKSAIQKSWADRMIEETEERRRLRRLSQGGSGSVIILGPQGVRP